MDESGDHGLRTIDPAFPVFVLMGLLIEDSVYIETQARINEFKQKYFKSTEVILHSRYIRKCEGSFSILFNLEIKEAFYRDLNKILSEQRYTLVASAIHKQKHIAKYGKLADDPYEIALTFVLERTIFELNKRFCADTPVMIESRGTKEDAQLAKRYNELLYRGSGQIDPESFQHCFSEELDFRRKSENNIGLQIADLCAYPIARHVLYPKQPYPSYDVIAKKIRSGPKGVLGYGLKMFP